MNASDHVIDLIRNCCNAYLGGFNRRKCKLVRKEMSKICDPDVSRDEKRKMLADPHVRGEIFSLLLGSVLPALVSTFVK